MLLCGNAFSQNDTNKVTIDIKTAEKIGEELILYDACKEENEILKDDIRLLKENIIDKDTTIKTFKQVISNNDSIDELNRNIIESTESNYNNIKDLIDKKNKNSWIKDGVIILLSLAVLLK
jgi:hypothetical protein